MSNNKPTSRLLSIPPELIILIGGFLDLGDCGRLATSSKSLCSILQPLLLDISRRDHDNHALYYAIVTENLFVLRRVLDHCPSLIDVHFRRRHSIRKSLKGGKNSTPLIVAVRAGMVYAVKELLRRGASLLVADLWRVRGHHTGRWFPINWAASLPREKFRNDIVQMLCLYGANPDQEPLPTAPHKPMSDQDVSPIFKSLTLRTSIEVGAKGRATLVEDTIKDMEEALKDRLLLLETLLRHGASPDTRNFYGETPLILALDNLAYWTPSFYFPVEHALREEQDALRNVVHYRTMAIVECLVRRGANLNLTIRENEDRSLRQVKAALHLACNLHERHEGIRRYLVDNGADVNIVGDFGRTPVFEFCWDDPQEIRHIEDRVASLEWMLTRGVRVNHRDILGHTPLHYLCMAYHTNCTYRVLAAKALLKHGANPFIRDSYRNRPIKYLEGTVMQAPPGKPLFSHDISESDIKLRAVLQAAMSKQRQRHQAKSRKRITERKSKAQYTQKESAIQHDEKTRGEDCAGQSSDYAACRGQRHQHGRRKRKNKNEEGTRREAHGSRETITREKSTKFTLTSKGGRKIPTS
jgi:ankyrin repeat protein